jgi:hypothetical protein
MEQAKLKRVNAVIDIKLYEEIVEIAKQDNRSLNYTIIILLMKAIKEKNRKRKNKIDINGFSSN